MSEGYRLLPEGAERDYTHVLLMRHGQTQARAEGPESGRGLSAKGVTDVAAMGRRLAEWVSLGQDGFDVAAVRHGPYRQVAHTMSIVRRALAAEGVEWPSDMRATEALDPHVFWAKRTAPEDVKSWSSPSQASNRRTRALLIVGHEPQLSLIARALTKPQLSRIGRSHVTPSAGVSCIRLRSPYRLRRGRVLWLIEPQDDETAAALREKIRSKMDVAKVFGAVITFALGILLGQLVDESKREALPNEPVVLLALAGLGLALVLYVRVLYAYDSLLMPTRFWNATVSSPKPRGLVRRPPSSATLLMQQNMMRVWSGPFTLANALVLASFGLLAYGAVDAPVGWIGAVTLVAGLLAWWTRVDLGAQD